MTSDQLQKYISNNFGNVRARQRELAYYSGVHPAIYHDTAKEDPDNRIPVPIPRKAVNFITGYMGKPGNITYSGDFYDSVLKDVFNNVEESILTMELLQTACINGVAYELHWTDGINKYFVEVPNIEGIMIYDSSLGIFSMPELFIRHWHDSSDIYYADVYDRLTVEHYIGDGKTWTFQGSGMHGYKEVPVIPYYINRDRTNLFNHVLELVDVLDRGVSEDLANELQRFASNYLLMANRIDATIADQNGETEVDKIKRTRIFDGLQEAVKTKVDFLTKTINPEFINTALDRIERYIYELIGIPNPSDETFAASSGIALLYKLIPLEYLATVIQTYFTRGLQHRIRLLSGNDYLLTGNKDVSEVSIKWNRNLPNDLLSITQIAMNAKGIIPDKAILGLFPSDIIPDVEEALAEMQDIQDIEKAEAVTMAEKVADEKLPETA